MTEIAEGIAILVLSPGKDDCWYCKEKPKTDPVKNDLVEEPSSKGKAENDLSNDSSKLGTALGFRPRWEIQVEDLEGKVAVTPAAHHLIPGYASLKKVGKLKQFMEKGKKVDGDVGYDVNCRENGVWLPGSYGVTATSVHGTKWSAYSFQDEYARQAMKRAGAQFHDSHPEYSSKVERSLSEIADRILVKHPVKCPGCDAKISELARPPYGLVGRLHALSRTHRRFVNGPPRKWPTGSGYFTSKRSMLMR
jgi:A nuclease family of the HNH/ENDO VII superfamily with conserved AHH